MTDFLGVRFSIWMMFLGCVLALIIFLTYWFREKLRKKYYTFRFPEKLLKVIIHYPSGLFKEFWRVIPNEKMFVLDGLTYEYIEKEVIKSNDFFLRREEDKQFVIVDGKKYDFDELAKIQKRKGNYPEIHYFYNITKPLNFNFEKKLIDLSSKEATDFKVADLFAKLLNLEGEKQLIMIVIIVTVLNLLCTVYIILKMHGVFDK